MFEKVQAMYFSPTKTTEQIINSLAHSFDKPIRSINLTFKGEREKPYEFNPSNLAIIGVPVYAGRIPKVMETYFKSLKGKDIPTVIVAVYGNRNYDDALIEMRDILNEQGFNIIAAAAFIGQHSYTRKVATNRPDAKDIEVARSFANDILEKFKKGFRDDGLLTVVGKSPYRERESGEDFAPKTTNLCIHCGLCAKDCPVQVIDYEDVSIIDEESCIHCCRCIQICPTEAKKFDNENIEKLVKKLINTCGDIRKEPELFI